LPTPEQPYQLTSQSWVLLDRLLVVQRVN